MARQRYKGKTYDVNAVVVDLRRRLGLADDLSGESYLKMFQHVYGVVVREGVCRLHTKVQLEADCDAYAARGTVPEWFLQGCVLDKKKKRAPAK